MTSKDTSKDANLVGLHPTFSDEKLQGGSLSASGGTPRNDGGENSKQSSEATTGGISNNSIGDITQHATSFTAGASQQHARAFGDLAGSETNSPVLSRHATEDLLKAANPQLTESEKQHVLRAFKACDEHNRNFIDRSGVVSFLKQLHLGLDESLLNNLLTDFKDHEMNRYDFNDMCSLFLSWKTFSVIELSNTKDWTKNPYVKLHRTPRGKWLFISDSVEMTLWNLFILLCAMVHCVVVFYRDSVDGVLRRDPDPGFLTVSSLFTVAYIVDIVFNARTLPIARTGANPTVDTREVMMTYVKSWRFVIDLLATLPLDIICSGAGASAAAGIFSHLRLLKPITALSCMQVSGCIPLDEYYILFYFQVMPLVRIFYIAMCCMFFFAAILCGIKNAEGNEETLTSKGNMYVVALYFVVQTFTTVGYGDIPMTTTEELWFGVVLVVIGLLFNGLVIGKLVSIVQMSSASSQRKEKLRQTLAVLQFFDIPQQLQVEILNFQAHVLWSVPHAAFPEVIETLPDVMRRNISVVQKVNTLSCIPQLAGCHEVVLVHLAKGLLSKTTKPEDYVTCYGDDHQGLRLLLFGFVDKIDRNGRYLTTLRTGDTYGFEGIMDLKSETYSLKALSYCDLQMLPTRHFHKVMNEYPSFYEEMERVLLAADGETHGVPRERTLSNTKSLFFTKNLVVTEAETEEGFRLDDAGQSPRNVALRSLYERTRLFKERLVQCKNTDLA